MDHDDLPSDWESQVARAYTTFGIWGKLDPEFLSEKAKKQLRDIQGRFRDMRAKIDLRHEPPVWTVRPRPLPPKGPRPFKIHPGSAPPLRESEVRSYSGAQARDVLYRAGFSGREADNYAWTGTVHTNDGKTFAWTANPGFLRAQLREKFGDDYEGQNEEVDRILRANAGAATDARYALARMRDLQKLAPGLMDKNDPFMIEFDDIPLAEMGAHGVVNSIGKRNYLKLRTELYGRTMKQQMIEDREFPDEPGDWEEGREWADNIDAVQYILAHELGHTKDRRFLTPGNSRGPLNRAWWLAIRDAPGMTAYAQSNAAEAYAEAFAQYIMMASRGKEVPAIVRLYAKKFGWDKYLKGK